MYLDLDEFEFTVGNTDIRIIDGRVQIKAKKGTALIEGKDGVAFTTTSSSFVDVGLISPRNLPKSISKKQNQTKLKKIAKSLGKNKGFLKKLSEKFPLELVWFDIDLGLIRARFKPKRKKSKKKK